MCLAGANGIHSVCVCNIHQNVILLICAAQFEETLKDPTKMLVCESPNRACMLSDCNNCPPKEKLTDYLQTKFEDCDEDDIIEFNQRLSLIHI